MDRAHIERIFEQNRERYLEEWKQILTFPSISADPAHNQDCLDCANWLVEHLEGIGFESRLLETCTKPVVFGERKGNPDKPVALFYAHYDVYPVDPKEDWPNPPFAPVLKDDRIYARGAANDKGQLFYALKAMETLIRRDALECTVKIILECEETCGNEGISKAMSDWQELIRADILMVADTSTVSSGAPTIVMGLRGRFHITVMLTGPHYDLHSGVHGGMAPNPAAEMARLVASLHNPDGSIAVGHFYDSVREPTERERELVNSIPFDMNSYKTETGVPATAGEKQFTPVERVGFRPSIDINGIHSGYGGAGKKTIIPAVAVAKITVRLEADQDPEFCLNAIIDHLKEREPEGLHLEVTEKGIGGRGLRLNPDSELVSRAKKILGQLTEKETVFVWEGMSIPVVHELSRVSGAEPLLVGFGSPEEGEAPIESFSLQDFKLGYLYVALMLAGL